MSAVFLKVLNLSINATWIILAVILVRLLLKKAPKWITCVLWALVAVRLIIPFSIESVLSLIPSGEVIPADITMEARPEVNTGVTVINNAVNPIITDTFAPQVGDSANPLQIVVAVASVVWLAGIAGMLIYALISYLVLRKKVRASVPVGKRIMACDEVKTPFILGVFRPVIYVPSFIGEETLKMVVAHEMAHIKRKDNWWKPLGFLLLSVYWFNPACWVAYILLSRDIESACDEKVIRNKDKKYMAEYSQALLDLSVPRKSIAACPLAFGETGVKGRVKGVVNYKKPAFWIIIVAVVITVVVAVCFLTNPKKEEKRPEDFHVVPEASDNNPAEIVIKDDDESMGVDYEYKDGIYIVDGDMAFQYKKILVGRDPNAKFFCRYTVLTNNPDITYEIVSKSLYSSNSDDMLTDTVIVDIRVLNKSFSSFSYWPTGSGRISEGFNGEKHPETDFSGSKGDSIYSISDGTVLSAGYDNDYGNNVVILSDNARIRYSHLDSINVKELDEIRAGDSLGTMGSTGLSTEPHLGLSLIVEDEPRDVMDFYVKNLSNGFIDTKTAVVNPEDNIGADGTTILCATKSKIIFSNHFGLFLYDKEKMCVVQSLDLAYIGCDKTQGDNYCEQFVSKDLTKIYLHPIKEKYMFTYVLSSNTVRKEQYNLDGVEFHKLPMEKINQLQNSTGYDTYMDNGVKKIVYLVQGETLRDLFYADLDYNLVAGNEIVDPVLHPLFFADQEVEKQGNMNIQLSDWVSEVSFPEGYSFGARDFSKAENLENTAF